MFTKEDFHKLKLQYAKEEALLRSVLSYDSRTRIVETIRPLSGKEEKQLFALLDREVEALMFEKQREVSH